MVHYKTTLPIAIPVLLAAGFLINAERPAATSNRWASVVGRMTTERSSACPVVLEDGRVLITGGVSSNAALSSTEVFQDGRFQAAASMMDARSEHGCALLPDGTVMVAGGRTTGGGITNAVEIYDPAANTWSPGPPMRSARAGAAVSVLQDHRVLISGGETAGMVSRTLEIFDMAGLVGAFLEMANRVTSVAVVAHGRTLAHIRFAPEESPYPFIAMVPQDVTERLLVEQLRHKGGAVEYENSFVSAVQHDD